MWQEGSGEEAGENFLGGLQRLDRAGVPLGSPRGHHSIHHPLARRNFSGRKRILGNNVCLMVEVLPFWVPLGVGVTLMPPHLGLKSTEVEMVET